MLRRVSRMVPETLSNGPCRKALTGRTRESGSTAALVKGVAVLSLVIASPPPATLALIVRVNPIAATLGVTGKLIVLAPFTGMLALLVQVAVLLVNGSGG